MNGLFENNNGNSDNMQKQLIYKSRHVPLESSIFFNCCLESAFRTPGEPGIVTKS